MKHFFIYALAAAVGVGAYLFLKRRRAAAQPNSNSLQANKPAPAIATTDDWMKDKTVVAGVVSNLATVVAGLFPTRWFNAQDTRQIYDENAAGGNVGDNSEEDYFNEAFPT